MVYKARNEKRKRVIVILNKIKRFLLISEMVIVKFPFLMMTARNNKVSLIDYIFHVYIEYDKFLKWESKVFDLSD